jgi:cephalosporin hydroxylase
MGLWSEFLTNTGRPIHKWNHYFPVYERHLARFVNLSTTFVEIGVSKGGSLQLWKRYLGPFAQIVGIDIDPNCKAFEESQIAIRIGDQSDPAFLQQIIEEFGSPDVVLDDGSHVMKHIAASFEFLYPRLARTGVYIVEDLHTAYWEEYGGGAGNPGSFIEKCKRYIDEVNAHYSRGAVPTSALGRTTLSMHFYDSVVVFERGRHIDRSAPLIGNAP